TQRAIGAEKQRLQAKDQLARAERLQNIVVSAYSDPRHAIYFVAAGGEEEYRRLRAAVPERAAYRQAVHRWKPDIEDNRVERLGTGSLQRVVALLRANGSIARVLERGPQRLPQLGVVLSNENLRLCHVSLSLTPSAA